MIIYQSIKLFNMELKIGDKAPSFELVDTELKIRTMHEFNNNKKIIIAFFVAASSPVCKNEMCTFQESLEQLIGLGVELIAISNDGPFANKAFAEKYDLKFPILGDYKSNTIRDYGVIMPDLLHIKDYNAAKRSIFIIDENGIIIYKWISEDPLVEPDYNKIKEFLKK